MHGQVWSTENKQQNSKYNMWPN